MYPTLEMLTKHIGLSNHDCHVELPGDSLYKGLGHGAGAICIEEALFLGGVIATTKPDIIIELGTAWGGSALAMGCIAKDISPKTHLISVDAGQVNDRAHQIKRLFDLNIDFVQGHSHTWLKEFEPHPGLTYFCFSDTHIPDRPEEVRIIREKFPKGTFIAVHDTSDLHPIGPMKLYEKVDGPMLEMPTPRGLTLLKV